MRVRPLIIMLWTTLAAGPVSAQEVCRDGATRRVVVDLLFGRNIGDKPGVSDTAFRAFLDREVTPRFPDGFTVFNSYGQWRGATGRIVRERGKAMMIALGDEARDRPRVSEVVEAYKARFKQQSVGIIERSACVRF